MNLHKRPIERVTGNKAVRLVSDNIKIFDYLADRVMASPYPTKKKEQLMSTLMKGMHITDPFLFKRFVTIFKSSIEMDDPFPDMTAISLGDLFIATIRNRLIKKNKNWISIVEGETGCLRGDTEIFVVRDNKIVTKPLYSLDMVEDIIALDKKSGKFTIAPAKIIDSGEKEIYEIELEDGTKTYASKDHIFFGKDLNEKRVYELKEGDEILRFGKPMK